MNYVGVCASGCCVTDVFIHAVICAQTPQGDAAL